MLTTNYTFWFWYSHNLSWIVLSCKPLYIPLIFNWFLLLFMANTLTKMKLKKCLSSQLSVCQISCKNPWLKFIYLFIYECLPRIASSILMNCYQWGSCLPCETPTKEPMELAVISNFHHRRPHGGSNSRPFDPKLNTLNHSATDPCCIVWHSLYPCLSSI